MLRERPLEPATHSNFGAFLDGKGDLDGAERAFRKAIELDAKYTIGRLNLAKLLRRRGRPKEAAEQFQQAVLFAPQDEEVAVSYGHFLMAEGSVDTAMEVLDRSLAFRPASNRLLLCRAQLSILLRNGEDALKRFQAAREAGSDPAQTETGWAISMHLAHRPVGETIAAYRGAIALNPGNGDLKLNLAQLLFVKNQDSDAQALLVDAFRAGLDDASKLEAQFYLLCHSGEDLRPVINEIRRLLGSGAILNWDVQANIDKVRAQDGSRAEALEKVARAMKGLQPRETLETPAILAALTRAT